MTEKVIEKKVVSINVAIALGIVCIILAVGLVGAIVFYSSAIKDKDSAIATKDSQIASLISQITTKNNTISSLNSQIYSLNSRVSDLTDTVNLHKYKIWVYDNTISQSASSYTSWSFWVSYAGYVLVNVESSTTNNTYVEVVYSSHYVSYDNKIVVGTNGIAAFPVLPSGTSIEIRVGNTNLLNGATETVRITYWY